MYGEPAAALYLVRLGRLVWVLNAMTGPRRGAPQPV